MYSLKTKHLIFDNCLHVFRQNLYTDIALYEAYGWDRSISKVSSPELLEYPILRLFHKKKQCNSVYQFLIFSFIVSIQEGKPSTVLITEFLAKTFR